MGKKKEEDNLDITQDEVVNEEIISSNEDENVEEIKEENQKRRGSEQIEENSVTKSSKKILITSIVVFLVLMAVVGFGIVNKLNTNVYSNIYLKEKELSGMSTEEVKEYISSLETEVLNRNIEIVQEGKVITEITAQEVEFKIDENETLKNVMDYGRDSNILKNNINVLKALFQKQVKEIEYTYSEEKLDKIVEDIRANIQNQVVNDSFSFDEKKYTITIKRGTTGNGIDAAEVKQGLINSLKNNENKYNLNMTKEKPTEVDVDVIYSKVKREPKDAYIDETKKPIKFVNHVVGIDFDKQELRNLLAKEENKKEGATITFKVKTTNPKVKLSDIKWNLYEDKIASTTTYFATSDKNRSSNLKLGLSILNGTIVMPGETFSFNNTMGDCGLSSRGFKAAATFKGGKVVPEVGGGICQVTSTLYNSVLKANLQIVKRSNHSLPVGYVKPSLDATVYYPYLDFKFKNTRNYPIKIVTSYNSSGKMSVTIMGTFEEVEYDITLTSTVTGTIESKKEYVNDASLPVGTQKVKTKGTNGYTSCAYKIVKLNGKTISKTLLSEDTYKGTVTTILVGTKPVQTQAPVPTTPTISTPVVSTP